VFALVYPIWFNAPPAILKGYFDRVFSMGFGFEPVFGGTEPRLKGRRLISFTTSGSPDFWMHDTGALEGLKRLFDAHLEGTCGLKAVGHLHFGGMVEGVRPDVIEDELDQVRAAVGKHFHGAAQRSA
jgi:NAD(P)H dehydrogenase (quinone)